MGICCDIPFFISNFINLGLLLLVSFINLIYFFEETLFFCSIDSLYSVFVFCFVDFSKSESIWTENFSGFLSLLRIDLLGYVAGGGTLSL
jgi:hypothetical protein